MSKTPDRMPAECIDRAAIKFGEDVYSVPQPGRHHDVCRVMITQGLPPEATRLQGFVTSSGRFVDRREALVIATQCGQVASGQPRASTVLQYQGDSLFSEDVW